MKIDLIAYKLANKISFYLWLEYQSEDMKLRILRLQSVFSSSSSKQDSLMSTYFSDYIKTF